MQQPIDPSTVNTVIASGGAWGAFSLFVVGLLVYFLRKGAQEVQELRDKHAAETQALREKTAESRLAYEKQVADLRLEINRIERERDKAEMRLQNEVTAVRLQERQERLEALDKHITNEQAQREKDLKYYEQMLLTLSEMRTAQAQNRELIMQIDETLTDRRFARLEAIEALLRKAEDATTAS